MPSVRWRLLLAGALACAAALRLTWVVLAAEAAFARQYYCSDGHDRNVEAGHALIHGLPHEGVFRSMPAGTVANALLCRQTRPRPLLAGPAGALLASGLLVFGLGGLLAGGTAGALALALFSALADPSQAYGDRWLFTFSLLLVAFLAAWRARFPSARKTALLAAAIGLSLNVLSVLFLLPPLLAAWDWRASRGRPERERRADAALMLLVPALLLLPWALTNWRMTGRLTFLESGRSDTNVITGALGMVKTVGPGPSRELAGIAFGDSAAAWAAGEVARRPLRFVGAVARRLRFAASLQPLLLATALLALWLLRRRPGQAHLGAVFLYFLLIHCLMPVEERYFIPLWPLAAALAASLAGYKETGAPNHLWTGLTACAFLPFAALAAYAQALVLAYPSRSADPSAWERETARDPDQAWLWGAAGERLLRAGRPEEAASALRRSLRLLPQSERAQMLSWTRIIRGGSRAAPPERISRDADAGLAVRPLLMRAMQDLSAGRAKAAAETISRAAALQSALSASWGADGPAAASDSLRAAARELIQYWPLRDRLVILDGLDAFPELGPPNELKDEIARGAPAAPPARTATAVSREALRRAALPRAAREDSLRLLEEAVRLAGPDAGIVRRAAEEYSRLGAPDRAVDALHGLAARRPRDLDLRFDLALLAHRAGRRETARQALSEARALCSGTESLRRLADAYRETGEPRQAVSLLTRLTASRADPGDLAELARLHMSLREYDRSLRLLDALVRLSPEDARWHNDRGIVLTFLGRKEEAIAALRLSLAKDPGMTSAARSLDALLSSTSPLVSAPDRTEPGR
jgi:tetratricopeptide (TPR) repeat protein